MRSLVTLAIAILITVTATPVQADEWEYDAGTGDDASGSMSSALAVPWGGFTGYVWKNDIDWYAPPDVGAISCVDYTVTGVKGIATLVAGSATASAPFNRSSARVALALQDAGAIRAKVTGPSRWVDSGEYAVVLNQITGSSPEPGGDAGNSASTATPWGEGCLGGRVSLVDSDYYAIPIPDGGDITVSAASLGSVSFNLLSPAGDVLATLAPGDVLTLSGLAPGTYTMSASSVSLDDVAYTIAAVRPPPCMPNC